MPCAKLSSPTCRLRSSCLCALASNLRLREHRKLTQVTEILCLGLHPPHLCNLFCEQRTHRGEFRLILCSLGAEPGPEGANSASS